MFTNVQIHMGQFVLFFSSSNLVTGTQISLDVVFYRL